jgi:muconolactone delta-isomerase
VQVVDRAATLYLTYTRRQESLIMQFLVTMTTHVPEGTPGETVDAIRGREAVRARELAAEGYLLRLWRPPLRAGEWRSLGLFAGNDRGQLEVILASMPLRVWRTDEIDPLSAHPNDPAADPESGATFAEFLTTFTISIPEGTPTSTIEETKAREARRAHELATEGHLRRLWMLPGQGRALGLWRARDSSEMAAILESLPLSAWMTVETVPLSPHPSDPVAQETLVQQAMPSHGSSR